MRLRRPFHCHGACGIVRPPSLHATRPSTPHARSVPPLRSSTDLGASHPPGLRSAPSPFSALRASTAKKREGKNLTDTNTRPTGAIAVVLNPDALLERGRRAYVERYPDATPEGLQHGPLPQMLMAVHRGLPAVVNGEGLGEIATAEDRIEVHFSNGMSWFPLELSLEHVGYAATDQTIDLADGIRTFGDRLNANHYAWYRIYDSNPRPRP